MKLPDRHRLCLVIALFAFAPAAAQGVDFTPSIAVDTTWTDSVFFSEDEESDLSVRIKPGFELEERSGTTQWRLAYTPGYEYFQDHRSLRGWDHDVEAEFTWNITKRTTLQFSDRFRRYRSFQQFNAVGGEVLTTEERGGRTRFNLNQASITLRHVVAPRHVVTLSGSELVWNFSDLDFTDYQIQSATLAYSYALAETTQVGVSAAWRNRAVEARQSREDTDFYTLGLSVNHAFSKRLGLEANAGPALVEGGDRFVPPGPQSRLTPPIVTQNGQIFLIDFFSCPTLPDGRRFQGSGCQPAQPASGFPLLFRLPFSFQGAVPDTGEASTTWFANLALTYEFETGSVKLSFKRDEDRSTSTGSSGVSNEAQLRINWKPDREWDVTAWARYMLREQEVRGVALVDVLGLLPPRCISTPPLGTPCPPGDLIASPAEIVGLGARETGRDDESRITRIGLTASYRWDRRTRIQGSIAWHEEVRDLGSFRYRDVDRITIWLGVSYDFEPIQF